MDIQSTFARNLKRIRTASGLSQENLGLKAGLGRTYIGSLERAEGNPTVGSLQKIVDALDVKPYELFRESEGASSIRATKLENSADNVPETHYSLCRMEHGRYHFIPIDVQNETLSVKIVAALLDQGLKGDKLVARYNEIMREIENMIDRPQ